MRVLKFIVSGDSIKPDDLCNFEGLFPGNNDDVQAEFSFSPDWLKVNKVIAFWSMNGNEYTPQLLNEHNACEIPVEALRKPTFKIQVIGKRGNKVMSTNRLTVYQRGGKV